MNLLYFVLFGLFIFLCVVLGGRKYRSTALYALAIGGVCNANFFHPGTFPIDIFGLTFGIDSIIYSLFIFCVIVMYFIKGKGQAYLLTVSSLIAVLLCALFQFVSDCLSNGYTTQTLISFLSFIISVVSTSLVVIIMLESIYRINKKITNKYLLLLIGMSIAAVINTTLYYSITTLANQKYDSYLMLVGTSLIGQGMSIAFGQLALWVLNKWDSYWNNKETKRDS